jgi:hypothetical protein
MHVHYYISLCFMMFVMVSYVLSTDWLLFSDYLLNVCACLYNSLDKFHVLFFFFSKTFYGPTEMIWYVCIQLNCYRIKSVLNIYTLYISHKILTEYSIIINYSTCLCLCVCRGHEFPLTYDLCSDDSGRCYIALIMDQSSIDQRFYIRCTYRP